MTNPEQAWETCEDGVALGPCAVVTTPPCPEFGTLELQAQAMWTTEHGAVLALSVPEDVVSAEAARNYALAILALCDLPGPAPAATA